MDRRDDLTQDPPRSLAKKRCQRQQEQHQGAEDRKRALVVPGGLVHGRQRRCLDPHKVHRPTRDNSQQRDDATERKGGPATVQLRQNPERGYVGRRACNEERECRARAQPLVDGQRSNRCGAGRADIKRH